MRVISGIYKGRRLKSSTDLSIRPTTDRIKELIFNVLQDYLRDRVVIDIFSGSGNLGIEALSRGAKHVFFVEKALTSIEVLENNLSFLKIPSSLYTIIQKDAVDFANQYDICFDVCFMDPPFVYPELQMLVDIITNKPAFKESSLLIVEHEITNPLLKETGFYSIRKQKKKGRSLISFIEKR